MAARNTISRLTSRIEDLAEQRLPRRGPVNIVGADEAECRKRLEELEAAGQRPAHVRFIMTGVPRSDRYRKRVVGTAPGRKRNSHDRWTLNRPTTVLSHLLADGTQTGGPATWSGDHVAGLTGELWIGGYGGRRVQ